MRDDFERWWVLASFRDKLEAAALAAYALTIVVTAARNLRRDLSGGDGA